MTRADVVTTQVLRVDSPGRGANIGSISQAVGMAGVVAGVVVVVTTGTTMAKMGTGEDIRNSGVGIDR